MNDQTRRTPPSTRGAADLTDLEVYSDGKTDGESVFRLRLHLEKADGVEFRKPATWDLYIGRDDLAQIVEKLRRALQE